MNALGQFNKPLIPAISLQVVLIHSGLLEVKMFGS
jgi:hypothetical protein